MKTCRIVPVLLVLALAAQALRAQGPAPPAATDVKPGTSHTYTFEVRAGDLVIGPFNVRQGTLKFELYDPQQKKIKASWLTEGTNVKVGFVAPAAGRYRVALTTQGSAPAAFTWQTAVTSPAERMAGRRLVEPIVSYSSPRVQQLGKDIAAKVPGALERFWQDAAAAGGPLIESLPKPAAAGANANTDEDMLITFLWRQIYDTYSVELIRAPSGPLNYRLMTHLPGTDVWFKTMKLRRGSRLMYSIAPNYRSYDEDADVPQRTDPLNPRVFPQSEDRWIGKHEIDSDPAAAWGSVLSLPGAPDESWVRTTPSRRGTLTERTFDSPSLKARISLRIYTPADYAPASGPYPLVLLFDGTAYATGMIAAPTALDNLVAERRIRPPIVAFVDSITDVVRNRGANLANQGFLDAIAQELVPWLRSAHAISRDPKDLVIGGYSAGAVAGARIALAHPDVFGNVLAQSGGAAAADRYVVAPRAPVRFYIDMGLYELPPPSNLPFDEMVLAEGMTTSNRRFRDILLAKGYDVIYRETGGDHSFMHWRATLPEALMALLPRN
jgi:enterochelin esterase-like enzyme